MKVLVQDRVYERHPDVVFDDVKRAVDNPLATKFRLKTDPLQLAGIGLNCAGEELEFVGEYYGDYIDVYHAMAASDKMRRELEMI